MLKDRTLKAIALVGSPKGPSSNSNSIADYMLLKLEYHGYQTEKIFIYSELRKSPELRELIEKLNDADVVSLIFPLYVDSLPAGLIKALELISKKRKVDKTSKTQQLMAICQSGFPESHQNDLALDMCQNFATQSNFQWIGGIAIGGGSMIGELDIKEAGGRLQHIKKALDIATQAIADSHDIPQEAKDAVAKMPIPAMLYRMVGSLGWNKAAKKNGLRKKDMYAKPYAK